MNEISARIWWLVAVATAAIVLLTVIFHAGGLGFWEPWESTTVRAGAETALESPPSTEQADGEAQDVDNAGDGHASTLPTLEGELVLVSWLKANWAALFVDEQPIAEAGGIGDVERRTRIPLLVFALLLCAVAGLWARQHLGDGPAAMTLVVLATSPIFYLGAVFLSAPFIYIAASTLTVIAFHQSIYGARRWRPWWALLAGVALAIVALDERLVGVYATLAVVVGWAAVEAMIDERGNDTEGPQLSWVWALGGAMLGAVALGVGWYVSGDADQALLSADAAHRVWMVGPLALLVGLAVASRRSTVGAALLDWRGALLVLGGAVPIVALGLSYAGAVAADPDMADQARSAMAYLLESQQLDGEWTADGNFAWWWRQVGFGLLPHIMFFVPALGFLAWKLRSDGQVSDSARSIATLCLVWPAASFAVVAPASGLGHAAYPAFFPVILAIGWMLGSADFWSSLRMRPGMYLAVAVMALFAIMVLSKDLENFSSRFVELALGGVEDPAFAEDLDYGALLDRWAKALMAAVVVYFAGAVSWLVFAWRDARRLWGWIRGRWQGVRQWWVRFRSDDAKGPAPTDDSDDGAGIIDGDERMVAREKWRDESGPLAGLARVVERMPGLIALVAIGGLGLMAATFGVFLKDLDQAVSSRAVLEQYLETADGDALLRRFKIDEDPNHFYVRDLESVENRREFNALYEAEERFFALIPSDDLAEVHSRVRRDHGENLPVLAAGGGMYLVTNELVDGEVDVNPLSEFVLDEPDADYIPLVVNVDGEEVHPEFDGQIEFVGYRLNRGSADETAVYRWGDTMEITMYFKVNRRINSAQEIFMHVDHGGNRLHGDHVPVSGLYPTNHWGVGDVIKDVHEIEIERFSTPGRYTIWVGFYRGDSRMSVTPDEAHDGQDRVDMAIIEVTPF